MLSIVMLVEPGPMEMQSSPVPMLLLKTLMTFEFPMWMPSVLGLSPGATIVKFCMVMLLHPLMEM